MRDNEDRARYEQGEGGRGGWHHHHGGEGEHHDGRRHHHGGEDEHRGGEHRGGWHHNGEGERRRGRPHGGEGEHHGGRRGGGRGRGDGYAPLCAEEGTHLLMIGSYSCTRHKGEERMALQQAGKLSFLCLQEIDWITGDYLEQIEEAAEEVVRQRAAKKLILFGGCQVELQSLDTGLLTKTLTGKLGIPVEFNRGCHLVGYGAARAEREGGTAQ